MFNVIHNKIKTNKDVLLVFAIMVAIFAYAMFVIKWATDLPAHAYAAQIMFVIGTDGGGLEHQNWKQNLKMAVKIQKKANEMYPGLFRPIIIRNSRYNQHLTTGSFIIEVGATGNTLDQCILSMQCLSNIFEEVCK